MTAINRRRFLTIAAFGTAAGLELALAAPRARAAARVWKGTALGAPAEIILDGGAGAEGAAIAEACRDEIARLEGLFSLYRADSQISALNRDGHVDGPDADFLALLSIADGVHGATGGRFDPTVQGDWARLAERYFRGGGDAEAAGRAPIGWQGLRFDAGRIAFARPGMAITLNGIAQGYVADRIAALLKARGLAHVMVDAGELRAIGARRDGSPWPVTVRRGKAIADGLVYLDDMALATSATDGTTFDEEGRVGHILDPETGRPAPVGRSVSVTAPTAAIADALSTAFCLMDDREIETALRQFDGAAIV